MKKLVSVLVVLAMVLTMVPAVFAANENSGVIDLLKNEIYETDPWIAEMDGLLTISLSSEEGAGYRVYINDEMQGLSWEMTYADALSYDVKAGDCVVLELRGYNPDSWQYCDATISWEFSFDADGVVKEPYAYAMDGEEKMTVVETGRHEIPMVDTADVTIVTISPNEAGVFNITVEGDAVIANCGATSALINTDVDFGVSIEWTCQVAGKMTEMDIQDENGDWITIEQYVSGQSLMLGIISDSDSVAISIEKTGDYEVIEVELQTYVNKHEPTPFTVPADAVLGDYVDVMGETVHTAVLGDDGYYHLDSADGDILLVDMDYLFKLSTALTGGRKVMHASVVDENNVVIEKWDIGDAVLAYEAACDSEMCYPLTEDLMFFYQVYASASGAYSFALGENYNPDCAWMYACRTMALPKAQEGTGTFEDPYIIHSLPYELSMTVPSGDSGDYYYLYEVEKDGLIEIKDASEDFNTGSIFMFINNWMDIEDVDTLWDQLFDERVHLNECSGYEVKQGDMIMINYYQQNYMPTPMELDAVIQFAESGTDEPGDQPGDEPGDEPSDEPIPDSGDWTGNDVEVAADEAIEIVYTPEADGILEIDVSCETGWQVVVMDEFDETAVWSDSEDTGLVFNLTAGVTYTIQILPYDQANQIGYCNAIMTYAITFNGAGQPGGDEEEFPALVIGDNYLELPMDADSVSFEFVATETGKLHFVFTYIGMDMMGDGEYSDDTDCLADDIRDFAPLYVNGEIPEYFYFGTIDVVAGESYVFEWVDAAEFADWGWDATLNLSYSDELLPVPGTEELPVALHVDACPTESIEIPAGERIHYQLEAFLGRNFIIKGADAYAVVTTTVFDEDTGAPKQIEKRYNAVNGVVTVPVSGYYFNVQIGNKGSEAAVFQLDAEYPLGSEANPDKLSLGTKKVALAEENNGYLLVWEATRDGVLTVEISGNYWVYSVVNETTGEGGEYNNWADPNAVSTQELTVKKGDVICIELSTFKSETEAAPADTITVKTSFKADVNGDVELGDVDGNGKINARDALTILRYAAGRVAEIDETAADVDGNGKVNARDALAILRYAAGRITEFN